MTEARALRGAVAVMLSLGAGAAEINVSGSAYVDEWLVSDDGARNSSLSGITPEATIKFEADVHEVLSFSAKACFSCHGLELDRAYFEVSPKKWFNVQAGRVVVPFGEFSQRYDPANHRTASKPLIYDMGRMPYYGAARFNLGVVPAPYVDTGVIVFGQVWPTERLQLSYAAFAVAGMRGKNELDFTAMRSLYYVDNNSTPGGGARLVMTYSGSGEGVFKDATLGVSVMYGRYDTANRLGYLALGVDASLRLGPVTVRGEAAFMRRDIDPLSPWRFTVIDAYVDKAGAYLELEHPITDRAIAVYRGEFLRRAGNLLVTADPALSPDSWIVRGTVGTQLKLTDAFFAKVSYELTWLSDFPYFHGGHFGLGGIF